MLLHSNLMIKTGQKCGCNVALFKEYAKNGRFFHRKKDNKIGHYSLKLIILPIDIVYFHFSIFLSIYKLVIFVCQDNINTIKMATNLINKMTQHPSFLNIYPRGCGDHLNFNLLLKMAGNFVIH